MSYDQKCLDLAEAFLSDEMNPTNPRFSKLAGQLAQHIQDAIEDFIEMEVIIDGPEAA
jgi:hypothetical protein